MYRTVHDGCPVDTQEEQLHGKEQVTGPIPVFGSKIVDFRADILHRSNVFYQ